MKWTPGHRSDDVIDKRGQGGGGGGGAGLLGLLLQIGSRFGIVGIVGALGLYFGAQFFLGSGPEARLGETEGDPSRRMGPASADDASAFVGFVLDDVQSTWRANFSQRGTTYPSAKLVLFTDRTPTGCGSGQAAMGPFYCPLDRRVFIDLGFFRDLEQRFKAPGDFARAYVIAHEVGHHVQTVLGLDQAKRSAGRDGAGATGASVRLELQADCFAGIWANSAQRRNLLETGDLEEGLAAASAVGDDRIQKSAGGAVSPETWTHGSAEQRSRWFRRGFEEGRFDACDTSTGQL